MQEKIRRLFFGATAEEKLGEELALVLNYIFRPTPQFFYPVDDVDEEPLDVHQFLGARTKNNSALFDLLLQSHESLAFRGKRMVLPLLMGHKISIRRNIFLGSRKEEKLAIKDLSETLHILLAGETGGGKSNLISLLLVSMFLYSHPSFLKISVMDWKKTDYTALGQNNIINLAVGRNQITKAMDGVFKEQAERQEILEKAKCRDIEAYNARRKERMRYHVVIFDECADYLMRNSGRQSTTEEDRLPVDQKIISLAQMGRSLGIRLIFGSQTPYKKIFDGLMKNNFTTRICFRVVDELASRIALGLPGAERIREVGTCFYRRSAWDNHEIKCPRVTESVINYLAKSLKNRGIFFT